MFEVIDKRDHGAAVDPQRTAQCLLGLAFVRGELAEHPEVPRVEVEGSETLGEAPMPMGAQLHQQKATLAAYVGGQVILRYDPRDLAEIRLFHDGAFLTRAICPELADTTISLRGILLAARRAVPPRTSMRPRVGRPGLSRGRSASAGTSWSSGRRL